MSTNSLQLKKDLLKKSKGPGSTNKNHILKKVSLNTFLVN